MPISYKGTKVGNDVPVTVFDLPDEIVDEINSWVDHCREIKDHPLSDLKSHENFGYLYDGDGKKHNSYQCSIPRDLLESSFTFPLIIRSCADTFGGYHRSYGLLKWEGHFDGYDIWMNFAYQGDDNPAHSHRGDYSGIIYVKNDGHPTVFPQFRYEHVGKNGTMILFPSCLLHQVNEKMTTSERITIAFNVYKE